jgi:TPR repeat protein
MHMLGRGVTRSRRRATQWMRKAAENGHADACLQLASHMYADLPYAREVGHVGEAARMATSAGVTEGHNIPPAVLTGVLHWVQKGCVAGQHNLLDVLGDIRGEAVVGSRYCHNEGCEVVGLMKAFKVCPQCKTARYCGDVCQKQDWTTGGHKAGCDTFHVKASQNISVAPAQQDVLQS